MESKIPFDGRNKFVKDIYFKAKYFAVADRTAEVKIRYINHTFIKNQRKVTVRMNACRRQ